MESQFALAIMDSFSIILGSCRHCVTQALPHSGISRCLGRQFLGSGAGDPLLLSLGDTTSCPQPIC